MNIRNPARTCPECGADFVAAHGRAVFCSPAHQQAFHNRSMKRGKVLMPIMQAMVRHTDGEMTKWARTQAYALAREWNKEDKGAGRRPDLAAESKFNAGWIAADLL